MQPAQQAIPASANVNMFLLALWIARPTFTHVPLRFEEAPRFRSVSRVLDRFQWIDGYVAEQVQHEDLAKVSRILPRLRHAYTGHDAFKNSMALTFRGCVSSEWQTAYLCFCAAAASLLHHQAGTDTAVDARPRDLADRLAADFAAVTNSPVTKNSVANEFKRLYLVGLQIIMSGKAPAADNRTNLSSLGTLTGLLRQLWTVVLQSDHQLAGTHASSR